MGGVSWEWLEVATDRLGIHVCVRVWHVHDAYTLALSLCRIVRLEDSMLTFVNPDSSVMPEEVVVRFPSLHALIEGHKHMKVGEGGTGGGGEGEGGVEGRGGG